MGKGNPIKKILKAPSKIIGEVTGRSDLLKSQKKQQEAQEAQLKKEEAVGDGYYSVTGHWIETVLNVGDIIILPTMGFSKLEHEGEEYWIGPENQVLGKLVEETNDEDMED